MTVEHTYTKRHRSIQTLEAINDEEYIRRNHIDWNVRNEELEKIHIQDGIILLLVMNDQGKKKYLQKFKPFSKKRATKL